MSMIKSEVIKSEYSTLYYLGYYSPDETNQDNTSIALMNFKQGTTEYVNSWINILTKSFPKHYDCIVRNLGPHELVSKNDNQYDYLCNVLAWKMRSKYCLDLISKNPIRTKSTKIKSNYPDIEKYLLKFNEPEGDFEPKNILVFDDLYDSGESYKTLGQLLRKYFPKATIDILVLCKKSMDRSLDINRDLNQEFNYKISYDAPYDTPQGFKNKGFFRRSTFFPQQWRAQFEQLFLWGNKHPFIRISLEASKESHLVPFGNFILGLEHTPFIKKSENQYLIDKNTLLGSYLGRLYFVPIGYKEPYFSEIQMGSFKYISNFEM